jgi:methionyl-tRNA formyltransferase
MNEVFALIVCNNPIAVPGIKEFLFYGKVAGIVPDSTKEMEYILESLLKDTRSIVAGAPQAFTRHIESFIQEVKPTIGLIMTFPFILKPSTLAMIPKGFINFHYGILPACRGLNPF